MLQLWVHTMRLLTPQVQYYRDNSHSHPHKNLKHVVCFHGLQHPTVDGCVCMCMCMCVCVYVGLCVCVCVYACTCSNFLPILFAFIQYALRYSHTHTHTLTHTQRIHPIEPLASTPHTLQVQSPSHGSREANVLGKNTQQQISDTHTHTHIHTYIHTRVHTPNNLTRMHSFCIHSAFNVFVIFLLLYANFLMWFFIHYLIALSLSFSLSHTHTHTHIHSVHSVFWEFEQKKRV